MTREEAIREMLFAKREVIADSYIDRAYDVAIKALEQPEIIRCKDCKLRDTKYGFCEGRGFPMQLVPDDGFCDKGKRSEG